LSAHKFIVSCHVVLYELAGRTKIFNSHVAFSFALDLDSPVYLANVNL